MEPTIEDGAPLIVDNSKNERIKRGDIYAVLRGDELLVKRVVKLKDGTLNLVSDNARYETINLDPSREDVHIRGRVCFVGQVI